MVLYFTANTAFAAQLPTHIEGTAIVEGISIEVSAKNNKPLVVVFLSARCPCSNSHIQELSALFQKYSAKFQFIGVHSNADEDFTESKAYFKTAGLPFVVIQDKSAKLADQFKAFKTPHAFVIDEKGDGLYQGGVSSSHDFKKAEFNYLRNALIEIAAGQKVRTPEGRTLGCAISRGEKYVW